MPWDPAQYHLFQSDRAAPFVDLAALVPIRPGMRVVDLGCGTGELTSRLARLLPESDVTGIDTSAEMLVQAETHARPGIRFERRAIEDLEGRWDLIFSHAAIQWVDDHWGLIPRLIDHLVPGGRLAVQVPSMFRHPAMSSVAELADEEPFHTGLGGWKRVFPVLEVDEYATLLYDCGGSDITVYEKVYAAMLENSDAVAQWSAGTLLVPYFDRLPQELHEPFMARYRERLHEIWPEGPVFYPFRRTLFAATA
jgi:trans-aconitate 2-methyltransferase